MNNQNKTLSSITFFNSTSDWIIFFSLMATMALATKNIFLAAYGISIKSLGLALGAFIFPYLGNRIKLKSLIKISLLINSLTILLYIFPVFFFESTEVILFLMLLQSITGQIFSVARESLSKTLGSNSDQRSLQNQILSSFFSAQIVGPLLGFSIGIYGNMSLAILVSFGANFIALYKSLSIDLDYQFTKVSIFKPFSYLTLRSSLTHIFIMRAVLYWIPVGMFNFLLFPFIEKQFHLSGIYTAWVYILTGCGSIFASFIFYDLNLNNKFLNLINSIFTRFKNSFNNKDNELACIALITLGLSRFIITLPTSYFLIIFMFFTAGISNGLNAVTTQTIRRKLCSNEQHPEIISLEVIVGRFTDWLVGSLCLYVFMNNYLTFQTGMYISGALLILFGLLMKLKTFEIE